MRRLFPATLAVGLVLLAGCSGDDEPEPRISPTDSSSVASTPTASPTPTGPVEPTLPPAAEGEDAAAAEAFVRFYWEVVNYAQATGDVDLLRSLAIRSCGACSSGADRVEAIYASGGGIEGGAYSIDDMDVKQLAAGDLRLFEITGTLSTDAQEVSGAGSMNEDFPAGSGEVEMTLVVSAGKLRVSEWKPA